MSIMFNLNQFGVVQIDDDQTEKKIQRDKALGRIPRAIPREELRRLTHAELEKLYGSYIEINRERCTEEEYQKLRSGETLDRARYGIQWRMWEGGFPTPEQMASTPWEEGEITPY